MDKPATGIAFDIPNRLGRYLDEGIDKVTLAGGAFGLCPGSSQPASKVYDISVHMHRNVARLEYASHYDFLIKQLKSLPAGSSQSNRQASAPKVPAKKGEIASK